MVQFQVYKYSNMLSCLAHWATSIAQLLLHPRRLFRYETLFSKLLLRFSAVFLRPPRKSETGKPWCNHKYSTPKNTMNKQYQWISVVIIKLNPFKFESLSIQWFHCWPVVLQTNGCPGFACQIYCIYSLSGLFMSSAIETATTLGLGLDQFAPENRPCQKEVVGSSSKHHFPGAIYV